MMSYAHQRGVIHRDLKPANILVADESDGQGLDGPSVSRVEIKVLDFGLEPGRPGPGHAALYES